MRRWIAMASVVGLVGSSSAWAAAKAISFSDGGWELKDGARVASVGGREVLELEGGTAYRRDVQFQDGTIDFDVELTRRRSFVYLMFRMADDHEYEEFYLRPHKSNFPDAVQYAPVWQGQSAWQLHRGPGGTAMLALEPGWTHVRVVAKGQRAALFVGDMAKPALFVARMSREVRPGFLALRGFLPTGTPGSGPVARYADLVVRPGEFAFDLAALDAPVAPTAAGTIAEWAVSPSFAPTADDRLPANVATAEFRRIVAEPDGLVQLDRHVPRASADGPSALLARLILEARAATTCAIDLGWSDSAVVFLDRRPIYRGIDSYLFAIGRDGIISFDQGRLYLPLQAGTNELMVMVSDVFGGAGLMGRLVDCAGVEVSAR